MKKTRSLLNRFRYSISVDNNACHPGDLSVEALSPEPCRRIEGTKSEGPQLPGENIQRSYLSFPRPSAGLRMNEQESNILMQTMSFPRRRESKTNCARLRLEAWIPAFAGMTSFHKNNVNQRCSGQQCAFRLRPSGFDGQVAGTTSIKRVDNANQQKNLLKQLTATIGRTSLIIFLAVTLLGFGALFCADSTTEHDRFAQANALYQAGEFAKAYETYLQIPDKSPAVYYNIGNCAYKLGKYGYALTFWRRAERDWGLFGREELLNNITLLKKQNEERMAQETPSQKKQAPVAFIAFFSACKQSIVSLVTSTPLLYLQLLVLLLWLTLLLYVRILHKKRQNLIFFILFACLLSATSALIFKYSLQQKTLAIIIKPQSELFSGPSKTFALLGHLRECAEADILSESGDFYKIRFNNQIGWVEKQAVEKV